MPLSSSDLENLVLIAGNLAKDPYCSYTNKIIHLTHHSVLDIQEISSTFFLLNRNNARKCHFQRFLKKKERERLG